MKMMIVIVIMIIIIKNYQIEMMMGEASSVYESVEK
jgi:hypothetical protein